MAFIENYFSFIMNLKINFKNCYQFIDLKLFVVFIIHYLKLFSAFKSKTNLPHYNQFSESYYYLKIFIIIIIIKFNAKIITFNVIITIFIVIIIFIIVNSTTNTVDSNN